MVLVRRYPNGYEIHGPPYSKAEENDFYRRMDGPKTVLRDPKASIGHPVEPVESPRKSPRRSRSKPPQT